MKREPVFDIMKGIGIIAVIVGHSNIPTILRNFIFTWHMPLFFIISGYFFKHTTIENSICKNFKTLIQPYFFTAFAMFLLSICLKLFGYEISIKTHFLAIFWGGGSNVLPNGSEYFVGAIWFLMAMFWCRLMYNFFYTNKYLIFFLSIAATSIAQYVYIPTNFLQGISAMLFFMIGNIIRNNNLLSRYYPTRRHLLIFAFIIILSTLSGPIGMVTCYYSFYPLNIIAAISGFFYIYYISLNLKREIGNTIAQIGRISLLILCVHIVDLNYLKLFINYLNIHYLNLNGVSYNLLIICWNLFIAIIGAKILYHIPIIRKIFSLNNLICQQENISTTSCTKLHQE